jgi:AcrR family transcriptional regulator
VAAQAAAPSRRADAQRNRERLVGAARELFASVGVDVSVREVAGRAGVGVGTLYRHFPTREELVDAVLEEALEEAVAVAEAALAEDDAWLGLELFLERTLELHARNRGLKDVVETQGRGRAEATRRRIRPLVARLVERAQAQGSLRPDVAPEDLSLVFWACDRVIEVAGEVAPELWRRQLGLLLDGLRAQAAHPLPAPPPTRAQLHRIRSGGRRER